MTPVMVSGVEKRVRIPVKRSIPPVFSRIEIKTVTPPTMMMVFQGIDLTACSSSAARDSVRTAAAMKAPMPTSTLKKNTERISHEVVDEGRPLDSGEADAGKQTVRDDPRRGEGRKRAAVRSGGHHDRHQEGADPGLPGDAHRDGREHGGRRDVSGTYGGERP